MAEPKKRSSATGEETKARIIAATTRTLRNEGIRGTSARAIAKEGDFNQALIFYHFGSIDDLIVAAVGAMSAGRLTRHQERLEEAGGLSELIRVARDLLIEDRKNDNMTVLVQAFAGGSADAEMGVKLYDELEPWTEMVTASMELSCSTISTRSEPTPTNSSTCSNRSRCCSKAFSSRRYFKGWSSPRPRRTNGRLELGA